MSKRDNLCVRNDNLYVKNQWPKLDVEIPNLERVLLDELPTRFYLVAHEYTEHFVGCTGVAHADLNQSSVARIEGSVPQLFGIHLA